MAKIPPSPLTPESSIEFDIPAGFSWVSKKHQVPIYNQNGVRKVALAGIWLGRSQSFPNRIRQNRMDLAKLCEPADIAGARGVNPPYLVGAEGVELLAEILGEISPRSAETTMANKAVIPWLRNVLAPRLRGEEPRRVEAQEVFSITLALPGLGNYQFPLPQGATITLELNGVPRHGVPASIYQAMA